jgi:hypothetical protein
MAMRRVSRWSRRSRFSRKRRPTLRSRRFVKRPGLLVNAGEHDKFTRVGFKRKRFNRPAYLRRLKTASDASQHYRSVITTSAVPPVPLAVSSASVNAYPFIADSFWTVAGGLNALDFTSATFAGTDLYLRGGQSRITVTNIGPTGATSAVGAVQISIWRARAKASGATLPAALTTDDLWDPSLIADFQNNFVFTKPTHFLVKPNESVERYEFVQGRKVDATQWNLLGNNRDIWFVKASQAVGSVAAININVSVGHNVSFSGDNVGTT